MKGIAAGDDRDGDMPLSEIRPEEDNLTTWDIAMAAVAQTKEGDTFHLISQRNLESTKIFEKYIMIWREGFGCLRGKWQGREVDNYSSGESPDKKEKVTDRSANSSSHVANCTNGPPHAQAANGGASWELLEKNAQVLNKIRANLDACKTHENINLLCQARNNILTIMNDLNDPRKTVNGMPPLDVKLNEELARSILPPASLQKNKSDDRAS